MVLADLGDKLQNALRGMASSTTLDDAVINDMVKDIQRALLQTDVNVRLVSQLGKDIKSRVNLESMAAGANRRSLIKAAVVDALCSMLDAGRPPFEPVKGKSNVIMFVGLQGSGKTTSCTKLAHYYNQKRFKTALVCADTFRAGAYDQLRQNATKANIPYYGSYSESDPVRVAEDGVELFKSEGYEVIIVDTSGRHKQEAALFEEMEQVERVVNPDNIIFTMDGTIGQAAFDQAEAFHNSVKVGSVILTKLDGHAKGGGALSAVAATKSPIQFIGTGEHIQDFQKFQAKSFVQRLLGLGDMSGLMEKMTEAGLDDQKEQFEAIMKTGFTMRIMRDQFQNIMNLGPLDQVMSMIPGLSNLMPKGANAADGSNKIKKCMIIIDSMNEAELDATDTKIFNDSRCIRIAKGAGVRIHDVNELFNMYAPFRTMMEKMRKMNPKGMMNGNVDPKQISQMLDPRLLQQMGGPNAINQMMKQMQAGGGPAGMPDFSKMFGGK